MNIFGLSESLAIILHTSEKLILVESGTASLVCSLSLTCMELDGGDLSFFFPVAVIRMGLDLHLSSNSPFRLSDSRK